jgi:transcriptional regulator with XRE-family HTH domain
MADEETGLPLRAKEGVIREVRAARGLSQADLAEMLDKSQRWVSYVESGKKPAADHVFLTLAELLGVSVDDIAESEDDGDDTPRLRLVSSLTAEDLWKAEEPEDEEKYPKGFLPHQMRYTRSSDAQGNKERLQISLPPQMYALLHKLSDKLPGIPDAYALARYAIFSMSAYLVEHGNDPALTAMVAHEELIATQAAAMYEIEMLNQAVVGAKKSFDMAAEAKDWIKLRRLITEQSDMAEALREPYHTKLWDAIKEAKETLRRNNAKIS